MTIIGSIGKGRPSQVPGKTIMLEDDQQRFVV